MVTTIDAIFDGHVFLPIQPIQLPPNTRVQIAITAGEPVFDKPRLSLTIADASDIAYRQPGMSHVTFRHPNGEKVTVPAHRPIKSIYIKNLCDWCLKAEEIDHR